MNNQGFQNFIAQISEPKKQISGLDGEKIDDGKIIDRESVVIFEEELSEIVERMRDVLEYSAGVDKYNLGASTLQIKREIDLNRAKFESGEVQTGLKSESKLLVGRLHDMIKVLNDKGDFEEISRIKKSVMETVKGLVDAEIFKLAKEEDREVVTDLQHELLHEFGILKIIKEIAKIGEVQQAFFDHAKVERAKAEKNSTEQVEVAPDPDFTVEKVEPVNPVEPSFKKNIIDNQIAESEPEKSPTIGELPLTTEAISEAATLQTDVDSTVFKTPESIATDIPDEAIEIQKVQPETVSSTPSEVNAEHIGVQETEDNLAAAKDKALKQANGQTPAESDVAPVIEQQGAELTTASLIPESNKEKTGIGARLLSFIRGDKKIVTSTDASKLAEEELLRASSEN